MKLIKSGMLAIALTTLANAETRKIDVSAMTCQQFMQTSEANMQLILAWFLGFYSDVENPQVIDLGKLESLRERFLTFCKQQPEFRMTIAAEGMLGK
jgi:acid stress chaperone HdeB